MLPAKGSAPQQVRPSVSTFYRVPSDLIATILTMKPRSRPSKCSMEHLWYWQTNLAQWVPSKEAIPEVPWRSGHMVYMAYDHPTNMNGDSKQNGCVKDFFHRVMTMTVPTSYLEKPKYVDRTIRIYMYIYTYSILLTSHWYPMSYRRISESTL